MRDSGDAVLPDSSSSSPSPPRSVPSFLPFVGRVYFLVGFSLCEGFRGLESTRRGAGVVLVVFTIKCNSCSRTTPSALPRALDDVHTYPPKSFFSNERIVRFMRREYSLITVSSMAYLSLGMSFSPVSRVQWFMARGDAST